MIGLISDSLAKRFFILMWAALVLSHLAAFAVVHLVYPVGDGQSGGPPVAFPTFPSLPPTPGIPDSAVDPLPPAPQRRESSSDGPPRSDGGPPPPKRSGERPPPRHDGRDDQGPPPGQRGFDQPHSAAPSASNGLPQPAVLLDYFVRLFVIGAAAWYGSRWLASPMQELVGASQSLSKSFLATEAQQLLDTSRGTREVREAAIVFNDMALQIRQSFRSRGLMYAAISHDLRTPLTRLRMRLETPTMSASARDKSIADIRDMDRMLDSVMELSRQGNDRRDGPVENVDLGSLIEAMIDDLIEADQRARYDGGTATILIEVAPLRRVVDNLLANALRYAGAASARVASTADDTRIIIEDDGPGIPPDKLEAVFEPFVRVEASRNRGSGGTGLGLYIARDLTNRIGGTLHISNRPTGGLRAEVVFPKRSPTSSTRAQPETTTRETRRCPIDINGT